MSKYGDGSYTHSLPVFLRAFDIFNAILPPSFYVSLFFHFSFHFFSLSLSILLLSPSFYSPSFLSLPLSLFSFSLSIFLSFPHFRFSSPASVLSSPFFSFTFLLFLFLSFSIFLNFISLFYISFLLILLPPISSSFLFSHFSPTPPTFILGSFLLFSFFFSSSPPFPSFRFFPFSLFLSPATHFYFSPRLFLLFFSPSLLFSFLLFYFSSISSFSHSFLLPLLFSPPTSPILFSFSFHLRI
ncbi:unnamed protein product [Acanthosepion pharaonis]|uniref:Uncharacterized protein n=1 Tax=Acanthosepion pharaonis TaxID=158019 RepID=A0A812D760_ACAPH|nr:unnamed protein product [Sepia pharaonis]